MSQSTEPKVTEHTSPFVGDREERDYAKDGFWQFEEVKAALLQHVHVPSKGVSDLRGRTFSVTVAEDGLHVTVEDVVR